MNNFYEENIVENSKFLNSIKIYLWILTFCGFNIPPSLQEDRVRSNARKFVLIWLTYILYSLALLLFVAWIVYINNMVVDVVVANNDLDSITEVLSIVQNVAVVFVQFIMKAEVYVNRNSHRDFLQNIAQLEMDILRYTSQQLNGQHFAEAPTFSQQINDFPKKVMRQQLLPWLIFAVIYCFVYYVLFADFVPVSEKILTLLCYLMMQIKSLEYCLFVAILNEFLTGLENSLQQLKYDILDMEKLPKFNFENSFHAKLMTNQFLLNRFWFVIKQMENCIAIPMLVLYLYNCLAITHTINWTYVALFIMNEQALPIFRLIYIVLTLFVMFLPCWRSQSCIDKYNQFGSILHGLKFPHYDVALKMRIREYSLQLMHQKVLFTCSGFFDINLKYYGLMILSITTYVVILIQFKLQAETEKANVRL